MNSLTPDALAAATSQLTTFPDVAFKIEKAIADDSNNAHDIGELITPDPALSAAVLRLANSASYNRGRSIDTIAGAVTLIGMRELRDLSYGICTAKAFEGVPNTLMSVEDFWRHSLYCAVGARHIGNQIRARGADSLFTAGLLHDIGHLVMFNQVPSESMKALQQSVDSDFDQSPYVAEKEVFGFDHCEVGAALAVDWNLPDSIVRAIRWHHNPHDCPEPDVVVQIVYVANILSIMVEIESTNFDDAPLIDEQIVQELGLNLDSLRDNIGEIHEEAEGLVKLFVN